LLGEPNLEENNRPRNQQTHLQYEVLFYAQEVLAVKHARQFSFFLAVLLKDLLVKSQTGMELDFAEDTVDLLWLDNSNPEDSLVFKLQKFTLCHC